MNSHFLVSHGERKATVSRRQRGGCQPGATPRGPWPTTVSALKGRKGPAPFQGAPESNPCQTQGVALG
jgi:hypothetical protein